METRGIRVVILALTAGMFFGGIYNVIELPFATEVLGTGSSGYSALVAVYGLGYIAGSLRGSKGGDSSRLKRWYLLGLVLTGAGSLAAGCSFVFVAAVGAFALGGFGNGLAVVHQRLLFQSEVGPSLLGRVFAVSDGVSAWGFAAGFLTAGALAAATSPRTLLLAVGAGELLLAAAAAVALRRQWPSTPVAPSGIPRRRDARRLGGVRPDSLGKAQVSEQRSHLVDGAAFWLALLDDIGERRDDVGIELGPSVRD
jgi:MFS family permease